MIIRKVKVLYSLLPILIIAAGCASSSKNNSNQKFENLVQLEKPIDVPHKPSKVYVDSVKQIEIDSKTALLINGTFPDGCTKLEDASHHIEDHSLHLTLIAWRNPKMMCTQALTPFSFIYDKIDEKDLTGNSEIFINNSAYKY